MDRKLGKIKSAGLEIKDRGILNFWLSVDYEDGCSQCVGNFALDAYDKDKEKRVGTAYGCEIIRQLLLTLNVDDFSEMKDLKVWIYGEGEGFSFSPKGISLLKVDGGGEVLIFDVVYKEFGKL